MEEISARQRIEAARTMLDEFAYNLSKFDESGVVYAGIEETMTQMLNATMAVLTELDSRLTALELKSGSNQPVNAVATEEKKRGFFK